MGLGYQVNGPFTGTAGEDLAADRLVKLSAGTLIYADTGDEPLGITKRGVLSGAIVSCECLKGMIEKVTASKAISAGAELYVITDGKVSDASSGKQIGVAWSAATADGGVIPAMMWGPRGGNDLLQGKSSICEFEDDFYSYDDTATVGDYVEVSDGTPAVDVIDSNYGELSIACESTTENETYISSMHEIAKFLTNKRAFFECLVTLTEANTDDANIIIGLSDTVAADSLLDSGAGPMASYDGAVFFKVLDGTVWQFETSNAGSQNTLASLGTFTSGTKHHLAFQYDYNDGVTASVTPFLDGVAGTAQDLTIAGLAEMHLLMGVKAGGANAETLKVDKWRLVMER